MKRILVLGGYGGFGARLSRRLAAQGWTVLVAGRNGEKAAALAAELPDAEPVVADRNGNLAAVLQHHRPDILIDAAGPFQASGYQVAEACIASGVHYIDLADSRGFVCGISRLDVQAREAGVVVISGASSVPALSGAVIRTLAADMKAVCSVNLSLSASNTAPAGPSVVSAILSYVGQPIRLWRGQRWTSETGWHRLRRERYAVAGRKPLSRLVALSDVPDHDIVPDNLPGRPATIFRAGPEWAPQLLILWLASWAVKWGWLDSLSPALRWLLPLQKLTSRVGSDRSAFSIEVKGTTTTKALVRRWTLIAENGDGPDIPTLAAPLVARAIADHRIEAGARSAANLLSLLDFQPQFEELAIFQESVEATCIPLYQRVMGTDFDSLPEPVRRIHQVIGDSGASGRATVTRGGSVFARLVATIMRFPPEGEHDVHVAFEEHEGVERWTRDFSGQTFISEISQSGPYLVERFGQLRFIFDLPSDGTGLTMRMRGWSILHIPLPLWLAPRSLAREFADGDDFCFDVPIDLPVIGRVVHYSGRLRRIEGSG